MKQIHAAYYEVASADPSLAVIHEKDIRKGTLCCACAAAFRRGARWGDDVIVAMSRIKVEDAPADGAACDQCSETIAEEMCPGGHDDLIGDYEGCGQRASACVCDELYAHDREVAAVYRPERLAGGGWLQ